MKQQQKHQLRTIIALTKKVSGQWFGCVFSFSLTISPSLSPFCPCTYQMCICKGPASEWTSECNKSVLRPNSQLYSQSIVMYTSTNDASYTCSWENLFFLSTNISFCHCLVHAHNSCLPSKAAVVFVVSSIKNGNLPCRNVTALNWNCLFWNAKRCLMNLCNLIVVNAIYEPKRAEMIQWEVVFIFQSQTNFITKFIKTLNALMSFFNARSTSDNHKA